MIKPKPYNKTTEKTNLTDKAQELCNALSCILNMDINHCDRRLQIRIKGLRPFVSHSAWYRFLSDLGYTPVSDGTPDTESFLAELEDYINTKWYLEDNFRFGKDILQLITQCFSHILNHPDSTS